MIKTAIIGTGNIADTAHALAIQELDNVTLLGVLSRDTSRGNAFLARHGFKDAQVFKNIGELIDCEADLVIITSPDRLHYADAKACLEADKHVLLEKPMTTSAEEALSLLELAETKNITLAVGLHLRSHVGLRKLHDYLMADNPIGTIRHIRAIWAFPQVDDSNWRTKDELTKWWSLSAVGSHCIDLVRWFAQDVNDWQQFQPVTSRNKWHGPHDETAIIAGQLSNNITAEIISTVQFGPYNRLELFGDKGIVLCDDTLGRLGAGTISVNGEMLSFTPTNPYVEQLKNVVDSIINKSQPRADAHVGLRNVLDLLEASNPQLNLISEYSNP